MLCWMIILVLILYYSSSSACIVADAVNGTASELAYCRFVYFTLTRITSSVSVGFLTISPSTEKLVMLCRIVYKFIKNSLLRVGSAGCAPVESNHNGESYCT